MAETVANWFRSLADSIAGIDVSWLDLLVSVVILAAALAVALLFSRLIFRMLLRVTHLSSGELDDRIIRAVRGPVTAYIIILGCYLALTVPIALPPSLAGVVNRLAAVAAVVNSAILINAVGSTLLRWFHEYLQQADTASAGSWALPLVRRALLAVIFAMAGMVSLDILGINISPLIAGLGIGGLAVALALQPTLSNLFAGTYVITEGVVSAGDYIEMEGGVTGYVVDVNWRSTRLRTWTNNLVVIPNSRFAETIITNYSKPDESVNVYLTCGVAYESDLQRVEAVSNEVMQKVLREHPGAVREYGAYFGYDTFGESNIDFWLFLQARSRLDSFEVRSALIMELHARLTAEGITINYPVRTLRFPDSAPPQLPNATPLPQRPNATPPPQRPSETPPPQRPDETPPVARPAAMPAPRRRVVGDVPGGEPPAGDGPDA